MSPFSSIRCPIERGPGEYWNTPYTQSRVTKGGGVRLYLQREVVLEGEWKV